MEHNQSQGDHSFCRGGRRFSPTWNPLNPLHRIATVMKQEGINLRTLTNRLGTTKEIAIKESHPECDMLLSDLYRWQAALRVPIADLLEEPDTSFSSTLLLRTRLLKLMRTVRSIQEHSKEDSIQTLARQLSEQLMKMMPELKEVSGWPTIGQRRELHELGAIASNVVPARLFNIPSEDA